MSVHPAVGDNTLTSPVGAKITRARSILTTSPAESAQRALASRVIPGAVWYRFLRLSIVAAASAETAGPASIVTSGEQQRKHAKKMTKEFMNRLRPELIRKIISSP